MSGGFGDLAFMALATPGFYIFFHELPDETLGENLGCLRAGRVGEIMGEVESSLTEVGR